MAAIQGVEPHAARCALALPPGTAGSGTLQRAVGAADGQEPGLPCSALPLAQHTPPEGPCRALIQPRALAQSRAELGRELRFDTTALCSGAMTPALKIASGQFDFLQISGWGHKNGDCSGEMG